jgi:hypothetical protein
VLAHAGLRAPALHPEQLLLIRADAVDTAGERPRT